MVIIFDTCVVLDHLFDRDNFVENARKLLKISGAHHIDGVVSAKSIADIHYLLKRRIHQEFIVRQAIDKLLTLVGIVSTNSSDIHAAMKSKINDFEDAIMDETASRISAEYIVTRNIKDFKNSKVPAILPEDFLKLLPNYSKE